MADERREAFEESGGTIGRARSTGTILSEAAGLLGLEGEASNETRRWLKAVGILTTELKREPIRGEVVARVEKMRIDEGEAVAIRTGQRTGHVDSGARGSNWRSDQSGTRAHPPSWQDPRSFHPHDAEGMDTG